jgi:hypothetical protein
MTSTGPPGVTRGHVVVDLTGCGWVDLALVDLLTRVCLQARRAGARVVVVPDARHAAALAALLELVGLARVVPLSEPRSEPRGQAEALEEPGVEEVVDVADPPVADLEHLQAPRLVTAVGGGLVVGEAGRPVEVDGEEP